MSDKKVLLSIHDLHVKFSVRGRLLTAIRGVSLDIYENETIAIVGESGCGKSVLTKTFSGTLDNNGFIDRGEIIFSDEELANVTAAKGRLSKAIIAAAEKRLGAYSKLELGSAIYLEMQALKAEAAGRKALSEAEERAYEAEMRELVFQRTEANNHRQTLDGSSQRERIKELTKAISGYDAQIKALKNKKNRLLREMALSPRARAEHKKDCAAKMARLKAKYTAACAGEIPPAVIERNKLLAKEIYLSITRYPKRRRARLLIKLGRALGEAMRRGIDLRNEEQLSRIFESAVFRVKYRGETQDSMRGTSVINLAKSRCVSDWTDIRGNKIAMIFQDPMTSLNPILTIGSQITSVIIKHQHVSEAEARKRAIILMKKVGIPNAENRFDDYPYQYSGGMRQRIVIAIALSCQPKILICDEPTTALDVTIQAQILRLIKDLQKEFHYTTVFITHDLGVVANIADRVAVLYAGQIVEEGTAEEIFYDPRHPYTWVLLSALPQLSEQGCELYSIAGTPPSLYNNITGDAFAPRNPYCLRVDTLKEPPMFKVSDTHYARTWLLDPRAPGVEKPEIIRDIHGTLKKVFNITTDENLDGQRGQAI